MKMYQPAAAGRYLKKAYNMAYNHARELIDASTPTKETAMTEENGTEWTLREWSEEDLDKLAAK